LLVASLFLPNLLLSSSVILEESFENLRDTKGWHIAKDSVTGDHGVVWKTNTNGLELQRDVVSTSDDGSVHAELDAHHNVKISTQVTTTEATNYRLSFALKPRDKKGNQETSAMSVKLFGKVVKINSNPQGQLFVTNNNESVKVSKTSQENGWSKIEIDYDSVDKNKKTLLFRGIGTDDSYGMLLDSIKLIAKDANDTQESNQTNPLPKGVLLKESFENLRDTKGWHILKGSIRGDHGVVWKSDDNGLELQRDIVSDSADGQVHAELDANHNVKISTQIPTTNASEYTLRLAIKPRDKKGDKSTSAMQINLFKQIVTIRSNTNGELSIKNKNNNVKVSQTPQDNGWSKIEIVYSDINTSNNALVIRGIGEDDSYGMLLDDIELSAKEGSGAEVIHGHTLPPEPDPTINNATLGGVDSNGNGVRDDVERAIYKKYDKKLDVVVLIDKAKFYQRTMVEPISDAKIIQKDATRTISCTIYLSRMDKRYKYITYKNHKNYIKNLIFNTPERVVKYLKYNRALGRCLWGETK